MYFSSIIISVETKQQTNTQGNCQESLLWY